VCHTKWNSTVTAVNARVMCSHNHTFIARDIQYIQGMIKRK
jgi:hypothetical protein